MDEVKKIELSDRMFILVGFIVVMLALFLMGQLNYQFYSLPQNAPHEINITGEGKAFGKPDIATVNLGMHSEGAKSQDVVQKNNTVMNGIISSLKNLGVDEKD